MGSIWSPRKESLKWTLCFSPRELTGTTKLHLFTHPLIRDSHFHTEPMGTPTRQTVTHTESQLTHTKPVGTTVTQSQLLATHRKCYWPLHNVWARYTQGSHKKEGFGDFLVGWAVFLLEFPSKKLDVCRYGTSKLSMEVESFGYVSHVGPSDTSLVATSAVS